MGRVAKELEHGDVRSSAELEREMSCQVSEQPIKNEPKMKVTAKALIIYCDSVHKKLTRRKLQLPPCSLFPMFEGPWFRAGGSVQK